MTCVPRRQFVQAALASATGWALAPHAARAIEPIRRTGKSHLRLSMAAYSYRKYLDLKKPTMTLDDWIEICAGLDLDAVEPTAYYFAQTTPEYLAHLKG